MSGKMNFEQSMVRLNEIVTQLEQGDIALDKALELFEEGTKLVRGCGVMLDKAEQSVVKLTFGPDGTLTETELDGNE